MLFLPAILGALMLEGLLGPVQGMVDKTLAFLPNLLATGVILGVGWLPARIVQRIVTNLVGARVSILVLAGAVGLREMGLANEIITIAFVLVLGSITVAAATAFGIGGRDLAGETLRRWREQLQG
jgi:hypothetical protein